MIKSALLLIDPQNDFCDPANGALGVPGADKDCKEMNRLVEGFDDLFVTMDTHYVYDIAHPLFWVDKDGNNPSPLTVIKYDDIGVEWFPAFKEHEDWVKRYVSTLEEQGEYDHVIWPEHCIHGSWGHKINDDVMDGLLRWSKDNRKNFNVIEKGHNILTEHFGAFRAQVPRSGEPETFFNDALYNQLREFDEVHIAGEAETHCVANTLAQLKDTELCQKLIIHRDIMSPVQGFEEIADKVFTEVEEQGANVAQGV